VKFIKNSFLDLAVPELKTVLSKQEESGVLSIEDIPVNWRRYESLPASSPRSRAEIRTAHGGIEPPSATPKAKDAPGPFVRTKVISATVLSGLVAPRPQQPAGASESATGLAYGSALHALLEYRHAAARDVLSTLPGAELLNERQLIADRDRILAHPAVVAALAMPAVQPEWPFALLLTSPLADSNANLLVRGKADLFAVDGSCARIVDYKSGAMPSPELLCAYRAQLALYVCAVKNAYRDVSDVSASLVFTSTAEIVGPLSETELMKRIRKLSYKDVVAE
ncbi:MAG: PD-(D/E)XK nuclease family protein, partial [Planctomycetota bacterium]|nr:PD-(D/E)XK nuclease family protein [Planctomycetota bacterium]